MIYYMCKYTPLEIFAGFGRECCRLEAVADSFEIADSLAHPNVCGYGKVLLEACSAPEVREVVLVNCCDVARRVYDILGEKGETDFLYLLDLPHACGKADAWMFEQSLGKLIDAYEKYSGVLFDAEKALRALFLSSDITRSEDGGQPYISLQGAHGGPKLHEMIQAHFSIPVRDDTCSGNRALRTDVLSGNEAATDRKTFLAEYARALLGQMPCMRMLDRSEREVLGNDACGIIYHTMKFCDYYGFEYASRMEKNTGGRIPELKIETDATRQSAGQLATRLDAFAERLEHLMKKDGARGEAGNSAEDCRTGDKREIMENQYVAGIDSGSSSTDAVIMDRDGKIVAWEIRRTGAGAAAGAEKVLEGALEKAGLRREQIVRVVSTGYGRGTIGLGDEAVTEITCHAKGAHYLDPSTRTIIDIGGQDSKVIRIDETGAVQNFTMNDKCAAGTGRFLEMMARTLEMSMEEMEKLGHQWKKDVVISSMCTVFAESEVVSLVADNTAVPDIIHGLNASVAAKTASLVRRVGGEDSYMMTGGVARNGGIVEELEKKLGITLHVSEYAQLCGAIGAALIAREEYVKL